MEIESSLGSLTGLGGNVVAARSEEGSSAGKAESVINPGPAAGGAVVVSVGKPGVAAAESVLNEAGAAGITGVAAAVVSVAGKLGDTGVSVAGSGLIFGVVVVAIIFLLTYLLPV